MKRSKEELLTAIRSKLGETPTDEELSLLEDVSDTLDGTTEGAKDDTDWKAKFEENDAKWRKKYTDRFLGKTEDDIPEVKEEKQKDKAENISIEDLFTTEK